MPTPQRLEEYIEDQYNKYNELVNLKQYTHVKGILLETAYNYINCNYDKRKYKKLKDLFSLIQQQLDNSTLNYHELNFICSIIISFKFLSDKKGYELIKKEIEKLSTNKT